MSRSHTQQEAIDIMASRRRKYYDHLCESVIFNYKWMMFELMVIIILFSCHYFALRDIYGVQISRLYGSFVQTEGIVVEVNKPSSYKVETQDHNTFRFHVEHGGLYKNSKVTVCYDKSNPRLAYIDDFSYILDRITPSVFYAVFGTLFLFSLLASLRKHSILSGIKRNGGYFPVTRTDRFETRRDRDSGKNSISYAPLYKLKISSDQEILFRGDWTGRQPEGESINHRADFIIYMQNIDDPDNDRYYLITTLLKKVR